MKRPHFLAGAGGGGECHIWAMWVCATVKGMVFNSGSLLWDRVRYINQRVWV